MIDDELREQVRRKYGDGIPVTASYRNELPSLAQVARMPAPAGAPEKVVRGRTRAQDAHAASKRAQTGKKFEAELDETHDWLTGRGFGHVLPHYPPTNKIPTQHGPPRIVYRKGGGPCDYSGHVNLLPGARPALWKMVEHSTHGRERVPVVFDAKVLNAKMHTSYRHEPERIAQIVHLRNAHAGGALAFLLVRADFVGRVFLVSYAHHADELLRSQPITLFETARGECFPLLPSVGYTPGSGWLWPNLLPYVLP